MSWAETDWERFWPLYWFQNSQTSREWDRMLNYLLDHHEVIQDSDLSVKIGPVTVWVGNWPYAYGSPWTPEIDVLPTVKTRKRLRSLVPDPSPNASMTKALSDLSEKIRGDHR